MNVKPGELQVNRDGSDAVICIVPTHRRL